MLKYGLFSPSVLSPSIAASLRITFVSLWPSPIDYMLFQGQFCFWFILVSFPLSPTTHIHILLLSVWCRHSGNVWWKKEEREERRAQAMLWVVLKKERSYGLENDNFPEEVGQVALSLGCGVSPLLLWGSQLSLCCTHNFSLRTFEMKYLGEVADLLPCKRF